MTCISVLSDMEKNLSANCLKHHVKPCCATHIGSAFLDITKDSISDTNASPTRAEAALYDFTLLLRVRLIEVIQPLIIFIFRHGDKIRSRAGRCGQIQGIAIIERTSSSYVMETTSTREPCDPLCSSNRRCTRTFTTRASPSICVHT